MAYNGGEIVRVTVKTVPSGAAEWAGEIALCGFWLHHFHTEGNTFTWDTEIAALPGQIAQKIDDHPDAWQHQLSGPAHIVEVKCARLDNDGHEIQGHATSDTPLPIGGDAGGKMLPPECAIAVSLWAYEPGTFASNKGRKRGRMYFPYPSTTFLGSDGVYSGPDLAALADAWQSFFNDIQGMEAVEGGILPGSHDYWSLIIPSKVDASLNQVHWVSVDNHYDSQRRRQHQADPTRDVRSISVA